MESVREEANQQEGSGGLLHLLTNRTSFKRRQLARERWTTAVTAILRDKGNQIGFTNRRASSLRDLREEVLEERERERESTTTEESIEELDDGPLPSSSLLNSIANQKDQGDFKGNFLSKCSPSCCNDIGLIRVQSESARWFQFTANIRIRLTQSRISSNTIATKFHHKF